MDDNVRRHRRLLMEKTAAALEKNGFAVTLCEGREEALAHVMEEAEGAVSVGFGGSMTVAALGLPEALAGAGKRTLVHGRPELSPEKRRGIMQEQLGCDLFLTGTNALTLKGQLVNIDATGNRVCAMAFGPKKVIVLVGANKIVPDLESALRRVRDVASPPNALRLGYETPCARTGVCTDCDSPQRICRITTIIDRKPRATDLRICLINDNLGY